jgi:hypothetical protein
LCISCQSVPSSGHAPIRALSAVIQCTANHQGRSRERCADIDLQSKAKERQVSKLAEMREALVSAGYDTTAKQAAVLGACRATAWVVLNRDKRVGPSASVIKRILSSPNVPPTCDQTYSFIAKRSANSATQSRRVH